MLQESASLALTLLATPCAPPPLCVCLSPAGPCLHEDREAAPLLL